MEKANVTPVYKKGNQSNPSNYRPISRLSCTENVMERCVHKHLYNFLVSNNLLTNLQSGSVQGDSTVNQLTYIYNFFCSALDSRKEVRAVFCDISKAFDRISHPGLILKLKRIGIRGKILTSFINYLKNREQRVVINGSSSAWKEILAGVPQGSILGQLLFLIFINGIVKNINSIIRLFADDTSLYIVVDSPVLAAEFLYKALGIIREWAKQWLVNFNTEKNESMVISKKMNKPQHQDLVFGNSVVQNVKYHKHLGLTFSNDGSWHIHIEYILGKAWQRINILRSLKGPGLRSGIRFLVAPPSRALLSETDIKPGGPVPIRNVKGHVPVPFVKSRASGVILARWR